MRNHDRRHGSELRGTCAAAARFDTLECARIMSMIWASIVMTGLSAFVAPCITSDTRCQRKLRSAEGPSASTS
jgi:hypothetical protein